MPSPGKAGSPARERGEFALRILALGALVVGVLQVAGTFKSSRDGTSLPVVFETARDTTRLSDVPTTVVRRMLLEDQIGKPLQLIAKAMPDNQTRALLSAVAAAGIPVRWTDSTKSAAIAIEATSMIDPAGGVLLRAAAPSGTALAFRDSIGLIDSVRTKTGGVSMTIGRLAGSVQVAAANSFAISPQPPPPIIRRILVIANPGWEAKFTTAALEERGWLVDERYALGRNAAVTLGQPTMADTARYAVVVALDSAAMPHANELRRYVNSGGGVVIAGDAATLRELGDLLPGKAGAEQAGVAGALAGDAPLNGVAFRAITPDSDAVVLARNVTARNKTHAATIVARRFGAGRVVQVAYDGVWQWRMSGPDGSLEAHRQWWSDLVSMVAFAPKQQSATAATFLPGSSAPYADLAARLGTPVAAPLTRASVRRDTPWQLVLLVTAVVALLLEWTSRRLRGAR